MLMNFGNKKSNKRTNLLCVCEKCKTPFEIEIDNTIGSNIYCLQCGENKVCIVREKNLEIA